MTPTKQREAIERLLAEWLQQLADTDDEHKRQRLADWIFAAALVGHSTGVISYDESIAWEERADEARARVRALHR